MLTRTFSIFWRLLPLLIFILPSLVVLIRQIGGRRANPRATFLIWSGLAGMMTIIMIPFSVGFFYLPIYFLTAVTALVIEFLPQNSTN